MNCLENNGVKCRFLTWPEIGTPYCDQREKRLEVTTLKEMGCDKGRPEGKA